MPYYIIRKVDEQERDQQYNDLPGWEIDRWLQDLAGADHVIGPIALPGDAHQKKNAIEAEGSIADPITVRFYADEQERSDWRRREERKFSSGEYIRVPWADIEAYNLRDHFVHLSRKTPGMIAYTANEEHGVRDRQTTIRPGRYLQQFYPDMLKERIDRFCGMCSVADLDLKITNDPEEIVTVYTMPNGPDSCMSHRSDSYSGDVHPVSVYGGPGSDLALAYIGSIEHKHIRARSIVWPDRKIWVRIYGDTHLLRAAFEREGYEQGELEGAKIRAIESGDGWIMPYVDGIEECDLSRNGRSFVLGSGPFCCGSTDGWIRKRREPSFTCERCESDFYSDDQELMIGERSYCESCYDRISRTCDECDETFDRNREAFTTIRRGHVVCSGCANEAERTCNREGCDTTWYDGDQCEHGSADDLCSDCADAWEYCPHCSDLTAIGSETCDECDAQIARRCDRTADLPLDPPPASTPTDDRTVALQTIGADNDRDFDRTPVFTPIAHAGSFYRLELRGISESDRRNFDQQIGSELDDPTGRIWTPCFMSDPEDRSRTVPAVSPDLALIVRECDRMAIMHAPRVYRVVQFWQDPPSICVVKQINAERAARERGPYVIVDRWNPGGPNHDPSFLSHRFQYMQFTWNVDYAETFATFADAETFYRSAHLITSSIVPLSVAKEHMSCVQN
jgi:hypothetical protein